MTTLLILAALAVLPVIGLGKYIYKKDVNKEPRHLLKRLLLFGVLSAIPITIVELILPSDAMVAGARTFTGVFLAVFITIGIVEEGGKWLVTKRIGFENPEFDEPYDIIVYAVFVSLGFAGIENVLYVLGGGLSTAVMRAIFSVPGHTCFGVLMGYYFLKAKLSYADRKEYRSNLWKSFLVPAAVHAVYDAALDFGARPGKEIYILLFLVFDIVMIVTAYKIVKKVSNFSV